MVQVRFIDVLVDGAGDCDDACLRFRAASEPAIALRVRWAPDGGDDAATPRWYGVVARDENDGVSPAHAALVEDSGAGVAMLVWGGEHGLWLRREDGGGRGHGQPYLLLSAESVELAPSGNVGA